MTSKTLYWGLLAAAAVVTTGCSKSESVEESGCDNANLVGGVCAGVPSAPLCDGGNCTDGGACGAVINVASPGDIGSASAAKTGDCVALAAGDYGAITLNDGVSLFGVGAGAVRVKSVTAKGNNVRLGGFTATGGIVVASGSASLDRVRVQIEGGQKVPGLSVSAMASVSVTRSELNGAGTYGISAIGASKVDVASTVIRGGHGPAVWASCAGMTCGCGPNSVQVSIKDTKIDNNALVGLSLINAKATLSNLEILNTQVGPDFQAGGGMAISGCSVVNGSMVTVRDSTDFGMLIDDSTATFNGVHVEGNLRGMWVQSIGKSQPAGAVGILASTVVGNQGVSLGVALGSKNVTVENASFDNTKLVKLPVLVNGQASMNDVGDGITWADVSQVTLKGVSVSRSAVVSVLIDGNVTAGSSLTNVTLSQGDEAPGKSIVQQNVKSNPVSPSISNAPNVTISPTEKFSVPASPPDIKPAG
jgi:hypothetical protein